MHRPGDKKRISLLFIWFERELEIVDVYETIGGTRGELDAMCHKLKTLCWAWWYNSAIYKWFSVTKNRLIYVAVTLFPVWFGSVIVLSDYMGMRLPDSLDDFFELIAEPFFLDHVSFKYCFTICENF